MIESSDEDETILDLATKRIFNVMVLPLLTYCSLISCYFKTETNQVRVVGKRRDTVLRDETLPIEKLFKQNACLMVKKCMDGKTTEIFQNYFII